MWRWDRDTRACIGMGIGIATNVRLALRTDLAVLVPASVARSHKRVQTVECVVKKERVSEGTDGRAGMLWSKGEGFDRRS